MKTYKAITVDGEMALKRLPEIIPLRKNFKHAIEFYHALQKHDIDYKEIESEPIIKVAPEYEDFWKEGDVVNENEFKQVCDFYLFNGHSMNPVICSRCMGKCKDLVAIPKPKEDEGELWKIKHLIDLYADNEIGWDYLERKIYEQFSITKKITPP